jgi:hypothetical protein
MEKKVFLIKGKYYINDDCSCDGDGCIKCDGVGIRLIEVRLAIQTASKNYYYVKEIVSE